GRPADTPRAGGPGPPLLRPARPGRPPRHGQRRPRGLPGGARPGGGLLLEPVPAGRLDRLPRPDRATAPAPPRRLRGPLVLHPPPPAPPSGARGSSPPPSAEVAGRPAVPFTPAIRHYQAACRKLHEVFKGELPFA